jgi:hypothetical protein
VSFPRFSLRLVIAILAAMVVLAGLGVGAYFVGHSRGQNLAAARAAGATAGSKAGKHRGEHRGYARGFKRARSRSFTTAYDDAFRQAYTSAFRDQGMAPPSHVDVPDPGGTAAKVAGD